MDNRGRLHEWSNKRKNVDRYISMFDTMLASTLTECQDDPTHNLALNGNVQVSGIVSGVNIKNGKAEVAPYDLAKRWNIGLETAQKTLLRTTPSRLRTSPNPLLSQPYSTNDRMLRYRRLPLICLLPHLTRFMPTGTHGVRHTRWQGKMMHMRHCHSCLHKKGSQAF